MGYTKQQKEIVIAVAVAILIVVVAYYGHKYWAKHRTNKGSFHGWRAQHYTDNPYNGQNYQCGKGHVDHNRDRFAASLGYWPAGGTPPSDLADANPYGDLADASPVGDSADANPYGA